MISYQQSIIGQKNASQADRYISFWLTVFTFHPVQLGRMSHRRVIANRRELIAEPQDVVRKEGKGHDQGVGSKFAAGQTFKTETTLGFAVKLLALTVVLYSLIYPEYD
jgi:hypothetical protein